MCVTHKEGAEEGAGIKEAIDYFGLAVSEQVRGCLADEVLPG